MSAQDPVAEDVNDADGHPPTPVEWASRVVFGVAVAILVLGAWLRRHSLDDAFINYRIVRQIQAGHGPVFNVGERVEAFTSPLWLAMLAVCDWTIPAPLEWIGMAGGIVAGAVGLVFAGFGARLLQRPERGTTLLVPLGAVVLAVFPPIYRLIATGLEDGITITWIGACVWALGRWSRSGAPLGLWSAALLGLGVLVRPDLAPFTAVFLVAVVVGDRSAGWRRNTAMVVCAAALPVASEILRMGYFGLLTPNTAIAKSAALSRWSWGWRYLGDTMVPYWFWVPVVILVVVGYVPLLADRASSEHARRAALVAGAFGVGALVCTVYIVRLGGDYMETRLLLGAIVGFVAPVTFVRWPRKPVPVHTALGVVAVAWIVVCGLFIRSPSDDRKILFEPRNAVTLADFQANWPGPIAPEVRPGAVYYMGTEVAYPGSRGDTPIVIDLGVGKPAYALGDDVYVLDALGLANPLAAHQELRRRGWPGHEKLLTPPWLAAQSTTPRTRVTTDTFPFPDISGFAASVAEGATLVHQDDPLGRPFQQRVRTARAVLGCARMVEFTDSYTAPMTPSRFARNLVDAPGNQRLLVPGEPADAADRLCTAAERARIGDTG